MCSVFQWCNQTTIQLGSLSSVMEIGVGLFLALAIVQTIGSTGMAKLRRKAAYLRETVSTNKLQAQVHSIANAEAELLRLEMGLEKLSELLFNLSFALVVLSLCGVSYVSLYSNKEVNCFWTIGIFAFYFILPLLIFVIASIVIRSKGTSARQAASECENEVLERLSSSE
jgi:hypothetical protein